VHVTRHEWIYIWHICFLFIFISVSFIFMPIISRYLRNNWRLSSGHTKCFLWFWRRSSAKFCSGKRKHDLQPSPCWPSNCCGKDPGCTPISRICSSFYLYPNCMRFKENFHGLYGFLYMSFFFLPFSISHILRFSWLHNIFNYAWVHNILNYVSILVPYCEEYIVGFFGILICKYAMVLWLF